MAFVEELRLALETIPTPSCLPIAALPLASSQADLPTMPWY